MMKKLVVLGALALLLLIGAFALWRMTGGTSEATPDPAAAASEEGRIGGPLDRPRRSQVAAHAGPRVDDGSAGTPATSEDTGAPHEMKIEPIKRAYIQREDGTLRGKDAPPPLFRKDTIDALRAAVAPAVQQCIQAGLQRNPDNTKLENPASVSIIYTASAAAGSVGVTKAEAVINGTQDDELLPCIEAAYTAVRITAPGQADGEGQVQAVFDLQ